MLYGMRDDAFDHAVAAHQRKVFTFARYLLSDREEAEDVTQDVLIRLWRHLDRVEPDKVGGWLLRVTRNACYDKLRHRRIRHRSSVGAAETPELEAVASRAPDPEILAGASQVGAALVAAIGALREPQRSAVILREIQGLSYREIADALEISVSTLRVTLHRGRRSLRSSLQELYEDVAVQG
jgi:RNA polymerase sigma-70 factor (ECF subfamily)